MFSIAIYKDYALPFLQFNFKQSNRVYLQGHTPKLINTVNPLKLKENIFVTFCLHKLLFFAATHLHFGLSNQTLVKTFKAACFQHNIWKTKSLKLNTTLLFAKTTLMFLIDKTVDSEQQQVWVFHQTIAQ